MNKHFGTKNKKIILQSAAVIIMVILLISVSYYFGYKNKNVYIKNNGTSFEKSSPKIKTAKIKVNETQKKIDANIIRGNETNELISVNNGLKTAYLTFDDGPSPNNTPKILDTLEKYKIKATFFIIGKNAEKNPELLIKERNAGHEIAIHSYCHVESIIYKNPEAYLQDIRQCDDVIEKIVGKNGFRSHLIRFPGGSSEVKSGFRDAIASAGYSYVDWNALVGDAEKPRMMPVDYLMNRLETTSANHKHVIILMHDAAAKNTTADALPKVIEYLKAQGFNFEKIP